jgi:hypothetical protein
VFPFIAEKVVTFSPGDMQAVETLLPQYCSFEPSPQTSVSCDERSTSTTYCRTCGTAVETNRRTCECGVHPRTGHKFCQACGNPSYSDESVCVACGKKLANEGHSSRTIVRSYATSPIGMAIVSGLVPWFGQLLMGQTKKAVVMFLVTIGLVFVSGGWLFWLISPVDSFRIANKLTNGRAIGEWEFF